MRLFWKATPGRKEQQAQTPQASQSSPPDEGSFTDKDEAWSSSEFYAGNAVTANPPDLRGEYGKPQVAGGTCALGTPKLVEETSLGHSTFEMILWRLNELEAKIVGTDLWERRVDSALADITHSHHDLRKQVQFLEERLGLSKGQSRGFRDRSPGYDESNVSVPSAKQRRSSFARSPTLSRSEGDYPSESGSPIPPTPIGRRSSSSLDAGQTPHSQLSQSSFVVNVRDQGSLGVSPQHTNASKESLGKPRQSPHQPHSSSTNTNTNNSSNNNNNNSTNSNSRSDSNSNINISTIVHENSQLAHKKAKHTLRNFKTAISNNSGHEVLEVEADTDRTLSHTVWNAAFLVGMNRTGFLASTLITFLLLINIGMQGVFLGVITNIVETELFDANEIERLRSWRTYIAHNVNHYDKMSQTSLAQRVCAASDSTSTLPVEMSDSKAALIESIADYLPDEEALFSGPSLSVIAITFWTLKVIAELLDIWDTFHGMRQIPRGQRNILLESASGSFRLANLTLCHKIFVDIILTIRLTICISLWALGIDFLVNYSIEPAELILNAVALEIVLSVDEVLFVLVPASCKTLMKRLEPLPKSRPVRQWSGLDMRSIFLTCLLVLLISIIYIGKINPLLDRIYDAQSVLCDGTMDFIFAVDPFMYVYTTTTEGDGQTVDINSATTTALQELLYPSTIPMRNLMGVNGYFELAASILVGETTSELVQISTMTTDEAGAYYQALTGESCADLFVAREAFFLTEYMSSEFNAENVTDCSQMKNYCNDDPFVRASCPVTCGCDIPFGDAFDIGASGGCPAMCLEGSGRWDVQMAARPCEDVSQEELAADARWQAWGVQFAQEFESVSTGYEEIFSAACASYDGNCTQMFLDLGCAFVAFATVVFSDLDGDPCTGNWLGEVIEATWKPLAPICPVSCNCLSNPDLTIDTGLAACPTSCSAQSTTTMTTTTTSTSVTITISSTGEGSGGLDGNSSNSSDID